MPRFLYPGLRLLSLCGLLVLGAITSTAVRASNVLVLGDSISAAYGMSLQQGWVAIMAGRLADSHPDVTLVNASISGETTSGALRRLPGLLLQHTPAVVIIELGGNDGLRGFPIKSFRSNLIELSALSRAAGAAVILVQMEIPPNYGARYTGAFRASFAYAAEQTDGLLAPFMLHNVATVPGMMQADGIHPSVAAQPQLVANILPTLSIALEAL